MFQLDGAPRRQQLHDFGRRAGIRRPTGDARLRAICGGEGEMQRFAFAVHLVDVSRGNAARQGKQREQAAFDGEADAGAVDAQFARALPAEAVLRRRQQGAQSTRAFEPDIECMRHAPTPPLRRTLRCPDYPLKAVPWEARKP